MPTKGGKRIVSCIPLILVRTRSHRSNTLRQLKRTIPPDTPLFTIKTLCVVFDFLTISLTDYLRQTVKCICRQ